jgi:copper homeostasis protein
MTRDASEALEDCSDAGFDRILTSGRQPTATEGSDLICELVKHGGKQIKIMPGSGVNEQNVLQLVQETGVNDVHFSAKRFIENKNTRYNHLISFLDPLPNDSGMLVANSEIIQRIRALFS